MLGLAEGSDQAAVRDSFLKLAKKLHPDSGHPEANAEQFQVVRQQFCFCCFEYNVAFMYACMMYEATKLVPIYKPFLLTTSSLVDLKLAIKFNISTPSAC